MRERKGDWRRPGMRSAGETKIMRREGCGRTRRYCSHAFAVSRVGKRVGEMQEWSGVRGENWGFDVGV